jgi:hypothetical protein
MGQAYQRPFFGTYCVLGLSLSIIGLTKSLYLLWPDKNCCPKRTYNLIYQNGPKTEQPALQNGRNFRKRSLNKYNGEIKPNFTQKYKPSKIQPWYDTKTDIFVCLI